MDNKKIPVVFAADDKYIFPMGVAMASMLENAEEGTFYLCYILVPKAFREPCEDIIRRLQARYGNLEVSYLEFDEELFKNVKTVQQHITSAAYYRLIISELLKEHEKCIYMDCDVLIEEDLSELFSVELGDNYIAAVKDAAMQANDRLENKHRSALGIPSMDSYINSGVLVMNLGQIRRDHLLDSFLSHMQKGYRFEDQDVMNVCCYGRISFLPVRFNLLNRYICAIQCLDKTVYSPEEMEGAENAVILHFANRHSKPWDNLRCKGSRKWWKYAEIFSDMQVYRKTRALADSWELSMDWGSLIAQCRNRENIVIFGYSDIGRDVCRGLKKAGIQSVRCFCDNDSKKQGSKYEEIEVVSLEEAIEKYGVNKMFVINTSQLYGKQIHSQLEREGIAKEQVLRYNHKGKFYYMALDDEFYEPELRSIYLREFGSSEAFDSEGYCNIVNRWKTSGRLPEAERELLSKYWMDSWLLLKNEEKQSCKGAVQYEKI